jgi:hypothetical protein
MCTPWCFSSAGTTARSITLHTSGVGSSTFTSWKRRDSAGSFSKNFLYSLQVVAARVRSSPRASAGLSRLAASFCPACPPAPIIVCASSMNRMMGVGEFFTSSMSPLRRFSNSPFTPAPACSSARSSERNDTVRSGSGTSPSAMRRANPSTTAVFPTPASPTRMGLFWRRRVRMSTTCRTSKSRPSTGSIFPARALAVRSTVYWSRCGVRPPPRPTPPPGMGAPSAAESRLPSSACASTPEAVMAANSLRSTSTATLANSRLISPA